MVFDEDHVAGRFQEPRDARVEAAVQEPVGVDDVHHVVGVKDGEIGVVLVEVRRIAHLGSTRLVTRVPKSHLWSLVSRVSSPLSFTPSSYDGVGTRG